MTNRTIMTIADFGLETAKQVPHLVVLSAVVWMFLGHMNESRIQLSEMMNVRDAECHEVQMRAIEAVHENTQMLGEVSGALREFNR